MSDFHPCSPVGLKTVMHYTKNKFWYEKAINLMPVCDKCKIRYGTEKWNDDVNYSKGLTPVNAPIKAARNGKTIWFCPSCYIKNHPIKYKEI